MCKLYVRSIFCEVFFFFFKSICLPGTLNIGSLGTWVNRQLWATMWVLRIKPRCSRRAVSALNHWTISLSPWAVILKIRGWFWSSSVCQIYVLCFWWYFQNYFFVLLWMESRACHKLGKLLYPWAICIAQPFFTRGHSLTQKGIQFSPLALPSQVAGIWGLLQQWSLVS